MPGTSHSKPQRSLTINIQTVLVQGVVTQIIESLSQISQLCVQLFDVHPRMCRVMVVGTDGIHTSGCSVLLRPRKRGVWSLQKSHNVDENQKEGGGMRMVTMSSVHSLQRDRKETHLRESSLQLELKESFWNTCPSCGWGRRREMKAGVGQMDHMGSISQAAGIRVSPGTGGHSQLS